MNATNVNQLRSIDVPTCVCVRMPGYIRRIQYFVFDYNSFVISERASERLLFILDPIATHCRCHYMLLSLLLCISVMMCSNNVQITVPYFMRVLYAHYAATVVITLDVYVFLFVVSVFFSSLFLRLPLL